MRLSELIPFLKSLQITPKKGLSQNFLVDDHIVQKILTSANIKPGDRVLEIGPGPGALTQALLQKGAFVTAIEKDVVLAQALHRLQTEDMRLCVYAEDALETSWDLLDYDKIVANLPYHITTPLLEKCLQGKKATITCMIQKEVADRIYAKPGCKAFGSLTLFVQAHAILGPKFTVSSHCFYPKPSVDSTVIHLQPHEPPLQLHPQFFPVIHKAFQQRRKMLSSSLTDFASPEKIRNSLKENNLREDSRPEMLSLHDWSLFLRSIYRT